MSGKAYRWLSPLVMITVASGCDNVDWGGAEVRLVQPPSRSPEALAAGDAMPSEPDPGLPEGPVLYMGTREGDRITLTPAAELRGDSLVPVASEDLEEYREAFVRDRLPVGQDLILFSQGVRVGRVRVDETSVDASFCAPRPTASGVAELLPSASGQERFLALPADEAGSRPWAAFETMEDTYAQRDASVQLEIALLRRVGARFPEGPVVNQRVRIEPLRLGPQGPTAFATTFVNLDVPRIEAADSAAWASFILAIESVEGTYRPVYEWHRSAGDDGKGIPLLWGHMDWDGDGENELLLEVMGADSRWVAAVDRRGTGWERVFQDPCGTSGEDDAGA